MRHLSELRPITLNVTGATSIDAHKAVAAKAEQLEKQYENALDENGELPTDALPALSNVKTVLTANTPYKIYVFDLTADFAAGNYTFKFVEEAPNVELAESLQPEAPEAPSEPTE